MTGATRGIGRAMAEAVLQADPDVRVINLGRGTHDDVVRSLDTAQGFGQIRAGERISYMSGVDLSDTSAVERAVKIVIAEIKSGVGGEVVGVINCAGQAALDGSEETSQMQVVNTEAPIQIAEALKASGLNAADFRYLYVSSLAAHPKGSEIPRLHGYGESKKAAVDRLKSLLGEQLAVVYPGVYETDMVDAFFDLVSSSLIEGDDVKITGFGNFQIRTKSSRPGRNPRTGEAIPIAARRVVTFHASQKLKEQIQNGSGSSASGV